jgi:hypothetical protein
MQVPTSFAKRITSIPRSTPSARPSRLALAANGRRWRSALLLAAAVTTALALLGGSFFAASQLEKVVTTASPSSTPTSVRATPQPVTPQPTSAAVWPSDFRSDGVLPATLADGVDHGTIGTSIGRARWVHLTGDGASLPDPLAPILAPDGTLVWFTNGGPGAACANDPKSALCTDPPSPRLSVSTDALAPRVERRLPVDVAEADLSLIGDTFWFISSDPLNVWWSTDLQTWQQTEVSGLKSPGPASIPWRRTISPTEPVHGTTVASVEYTAADPGSLLGFPGRHVALAQGGGGYVAREYHPMREGGDKDLGAIKVRTTVDGIRFMDADGREVGRVDGVGMEFVDMWLRQGITYRQLAVLDRERWSPVDLPVAPLADWPMLVKVGDALLAFVVEPDERVRAWRTVDGHTWTGGDVLVADDGTPIQSTGVTYRAGENGPILVVLGKDDRSGWKSTDGEKWTPTSFDSGETPPIRIAQGWFRTGDQTADGDWQVSPDGSTWQSVPALRDVVGKTAPSGAGGSSESVVGNTVFFSVDEAGAPFTRDVWMIEFEKPVP